jgi:hypothetical protein
MKFLLQIIQDDGPAHAIVDVTPGERDFIINCRELWQEVKKRQPELVEMSFLDGAARYFGYIEESEADNEDEIFEPEEDFGSYHNNGFGRLRDDFETGNDVEEYRTDADHVLVCEQGVAWVAFDHYTGQRAETRVLPYSRLLEGS